MNLLWISNFVTTIWEVPTLRFTRERRSYIHHFIFNYNFAVHFLQSLPCSLSEVSNRQSRTVELPRMWLAEILSSASWREIYGILTHWSWVMNICVSKLTMIGSDNGARGQAIVWTSAGILLIGPLGTNFSEILIEIHTFSFKKMHLKMSLQNGPISSWLNVLAMMLTCNNVLCTW